MSKALTIVAVIAIGSPAVTNSRDAGVIARHLNRGYLHVEEKSDSPWTTALMGGVGGAAVGALSGCVTASATGGDCAGAATTGALAGGAVGAVGGYAAGAMNPNADTKTQVLMGAGVMAGAGVAGAGAVAITGAGGAMGGGLLGGGSSSSSAAPQSQAIDPATGQPIAAKQQIDPMTGQPVAGTGMGTPTMQGQMPYGGASSTAAVSAAAIVAGLCLL